MTRRPPDLPHQLGAFTTGQAGGARWTESALRNGVRAGAVDRLWRGAYASPVSDSPTGRARRIAQRSVAAALTNPGGLASHLGAAAVLDLEWWAPRPRPCLTVHSGAVTVVPGVHVHRAAVDPRDRWRGESVLLTSPARTVVDIAREFGEESGVVTGDAALRRGSVSHDDLVRAVRTATGRPGVRRARAMLALLDGNAESVLESRSRFRMDAAGLPPPLTQVDIYDLNGIWLARVDFYWPEFGVVGEADGDLKYDGRADVVREKYREDALRGVGLVVVRWGWRQLDPFDPTARRLAQAFGRGEARLSRRRWRAADGADVVRSVSVAAEQGRFEQHP